MISIKLLIKIFVPILLMFSLGLFNFFYLTSEYKVLKNESLNQFTISQGIFSDLIRSDVLQGFRDQVYAKCKMYYSKNIRYLKVEMTDGTVLCNFGRDDSFSRSNLIQTKMFFSNEQPSIAATISASYEIQGLSLAYKNRISRLALTVVAIGVAQWLVLNGLVGRIFGQLNVMANSISSGRLSDIERTSYKVYETSRLVEIRTIASEFLRMVESIRYFGIKATQTDLDLARSKIFKQVVHDLRSPLSVIDILIHKLKRSGDDEVSSLIEKVGMRIAEITQSLYTRSEVSVGIGSIDLSSTVSWVLAEKRVEYPEVKWKLDSEEEIFCIVDNSKLGRAISNILNNCVDAKKEDSQLEVNISIGSQSLFAHVTIEDNGVGLEPEVLERILLKGGTFGKEGGQGLGLGQVKELIEAVEGKFSMRSLPSKGTTVELLIPLALQRGS